MARTKSKKAPDVGEKTVAQTGGDIAGFGPGLYGAPLASLGLGGFYGASYGGLGYANTWGSYGVPVAALRGTGAYEGTNRYDSPAQTYAGSVGFANVTTPGNDIHRPPPGTLPTYRLMSAHPTLALTASVTFAPVVGTDWSVEQMDDAPAGAKDAIQAVVDRLRVPLTMDCLRAMAMGFSPFEILWEVREGLMVPARLKYLIPELTSILVDTHGNISGLQQGDIRIGIEKSAVYVSDLEGSNYYGRSRHENCRRAWANWLMADDNLARLGVMSRSVIPRVHYAPGQGLDANGLPVSNDKLATQVANGMAELRPVIIPNLSGMDVGDLARMPEYAKLSQWAVDTIDMGSVAPSIASVLNALGYYDKLLVRGWLMPERAVLEAQSGGIGAGDASNHGDVGMAGADQTIGSIVRFFNETIANAILELNYGAKAVGKVFAKAAPRDPEKQSFFRQLALTVAGNPQALPQILGGIDRDAWIDSLSLPKSKENLAPFDENALKPPVPAPPSAENPAKPGNPKQTKPKEQANGPKK